MRIKFKKLRKLAIKEAVENINESIALCETPEGLRSVMSRYDKKYKGNEKEKMLKLLAKYRVEKIADVNQEIDRLENAPDFNDIFTITVEWKRSRMWGSNPTAYTNYGYQSDSIGGCGYCKHSTATARALNSNDSILKLMCAKTERALRKGESIKNRDLLGYGAGYSALPRFEGGVGVNSHRGIIEGLGLKWNDITSTKNVDVHTITK